MTPSVPHRPVRILHCDDSPAIRALVAEVLRPFAGLEVVEQVDCHASVIARAAVLQPDIVLLDLDAGRDEQVVTRLRESCSAWIIVFSGEPGLERDPLAVQADAFVAKEIGATAVIRAVLAAAADHDDWWLSRLRAAIAENRFEPHTRPVAGLASDAGPAHHVSLTMIEGDGATVGPERFMPVATRCGMAAVLDRRTLRAAVRFAAEGHAAYVDLSASTMADPETFAFLVDALRATGARPERVGLVVDAAAFDSDPSRVFLDRARRLGCQVASGIAGEEIARLGVERPVRRLAALA